MDSPQQTLSAVQYAEKYDYKNLLTVVQLRPLLAQETDEFGMTPLHWICSDSKVPTRVVQRVVLAFPQATAAKNLAGLLPLHIALRKNLPLEALKMLLKFNPKAILVHTPDGKSPMDLAKENITSSSTKIFLHMLDAELRALKRTVHDSNKDNDKHPSSNGSRASTATSELKKRSQSPQSSNPADQDDELDESCDYNDDHFVMNNQDDEEDEKERSLFMQPTFSESQPLVSDLLDSSNNRTTTRPQIPPAWRLDKCCYMCDVKFSYFKKRHHCRNCGESVCGKHSRHSLPLKHLGLFHPQRVCNLCFQSVQDRYTTHTLMQVLSPQHHGVVFHTSFGPPSPGILMMNERLGKKITRSQSVRDEATHSHYGVMDSPRDNFTDTGSCRSGNWFSPRSVFTPTNNQNISTPLGRHKSIPSFISTPNAGSIHVTTMSRRKNALTVMERQQQLRQQEQLQQIPRKHDRSRLAQTEVEARSTAWEEDLDQLSNQRSVNPRLSMGSQVNQLEEHMQKLLQAKKQIGEALKQSQRDVEVARQKKLQYDAVASEFEGRGFVRSSSAVSEKDFEGASLQNNTEKKSGKPTRHPNTDITPNTRARILIPRSSPHLSPYRPEKLTLGVSLDVAATHHELGVALLGKADFSSAAIEFQKSIDIYSDNAVVWYHLAKALDSKGDKLGAEKAVQKALTIEPESLSSLSLLGKLLHLRGEHDEAITVFRRALKLQCPTSTY